MRVAPETVAALRCSLARFEGEASAGARSPITFGWSELDGFLDGGLPRGALHDLVARENEGPALVGFASVLARRAAGRKPVLWARQEVVNGLAGRLYPAGLAELGLDPGVLVTVEARDAVGVLRAGADALRCAALGAVLIEPWGEPKVLDLTATRRLALAAAHSGIPVFLLRRVVRASPSAAATRWAVRSAPSAALEANAPGAPAFSITLLRYRAGLSERTWKLEWDRDKQRFGAATPLSRLVVPVSPRPASRPAPVVEPFRRAG